MIHFSCTRVLHRPLQFRYSSYLRSCIHNTCPSDISDILYDKSPRVDICYNISRYRKPHPDRTDYDDQIRDCIALLIFETYFSRQQHYLSVFMQLVNIVRDSACSNDLIFDVFEMVHSRDVVVS